MILDDSQIKTREVTQWQGVHLLHYSMSSCSQKVRILMGELGLNFTSHHVNLRAGEQKSDWYTGINPNAVVPVLIHDGVVHIESNDIIAYLEAEFGNPERPLLGDSQEARNQIQALMDLEDRLHADLRTITFTYLAPGDAVVSERFNAIGRFNDACQQLDARLRQQAFLLGEQLTLADIAWFISLHRLVLARMPMTAHPNLLDYYQRLAKRPAFKQQLLAGPVSLRAAAAVYRTLNRLFNRSLTRDFTQWQRSATANR